MHRISIIRKLALDADSIVVPTTKQKKRQSTKDVGGAAADDSGEPARKKDKRAPATPKSKKAAVVEDVNLSGNRNGNATVEDRYENEDNETIQPETEV